jgi:hypothetical protein
MSSGRNESWSIFSVPTVAAARAGRAGRIATQRSGSRRPPRAPSASLRHMPAGQTAQLRLLSGFVAVKAPLPRALSTTMRPLVKIFDRWAKYSTAGQNI